MSRARFIVVEGPDGSGTSLHSKLLAERLSGMGMETVLTAEPSDGPAGMCIRTLLKAGSRTDPAALQLLFCADRADHLQRVIRPALSRDAVVVCDRYVLSTLVYGRAMGVDVEWLQQINAPFPQPDLHILTLPPYPVCRERLTRRPQRDMLEEEHLQQAIYDGYRTLAPKGAILLNTSGEKHQVAEHLWKRVAPQVVNRAIA